MTVADVARQRNVKESTVIGHLERLAAQGETLALDHLFQDQARLRRIQEAYDACGLDLLKPVWEHLGGEFSYEELRLVRIFLRQERSREA